MTEFLRPGSLSLVLLVASAACGDDGPVGDASIDPDATTDGGLRAEPAPPAPPEWPCPSGWTSVEPVPGTGACHPFPEATEALCPSGQLRAPGAAACAPVGEGCPMRFPTDLPSDRPVVYVDAAAASGGDGTPSAPYDAIGFALGSAPTAAVIAVAAGRYDETLALRRDVEIVGACASEVIVGAADGEGLVASGGASVVRRVTVVSSGFGMTVRGGATALELDQVLLRDARGAGIIVDAGTLRARDTVVEGTRASAAVPSGGRAINVQNGGRAELERVALVASQTAGIALQSGAELVMTDSVVDGVIAGGGSRGVGVQVLGSTATLERVVVRRVGQLALDVLMGGEVDATDVVLEDCGLGSVAAVGGTVRMTRSLITRQGTGALFAREAASMELIDSFVTDTLPAADGTYGRAVDVSEGSRVRFLRVVIARAHEGGLVAIETDLAAEDLVVRDVMTAEGPGRFGRGVYVLRGTVALTRTAVEDVRELGLVMDDTTGSLSDVTVRGVSSDALGEFGHGIHLERGTEASLTRVEVERASGVGILAMTATATIEEVRVTETMPSGCIADGCNQAAGVGFLVFDGAASIRGFEIADNALAGLQLASGDLDLEGGVVRGHPIGIAVAVDGYETARLSNEVAFVDNETNLDARSLPVPAGAATLAP